MKYAAFILIILTLASCKTGDKWECIGNCIDGEGTKKWKDDGIERGTWIDGELTGPGFQLFGSASDFANDYYEGAFLQGRYHGFGTYTSPSRDAIQIGFWENGKAEGKGKLTFGAKSKYPNRYYDGEWKNGLRNGYGVQFFGTAGKYANNRYEGEWKNDEMHGHGRYEWPDKGTSIGTWRNGEQHGNGIFIFRNGDTLKSNWIDGYCRELALIFYGESASTFRTLIEELNNASDKASQRFIDETTKEISLYKNNSSHDVDFSFLKELLDTAIILKKEVLPKLEKLTEYDNEIRYKQDFLKVQYSIMEVLFESDKWISFNLERKESDSILDSSNNVFEKLRVLQDSQDSFEKTKKIFKEKYLE